MDKIIVGIAEGKTAKHGEVLISYALGSCVGVCLFDRKHKIAGLAHIILPETSFAVNCQNEYKFASEGVRQLIIDMCRQGAEKRFMVAKIAGGAKMFNSAENQWNIGERNVDRVKKTLSEERIRIGAEDTGKDYGRTIAFMSEDGSLEVSTVRQKVLLL